MLATPLAVTIKLMQNLVPDAADLLRAVDTASLVVLNLGLDESRVEHPMQGYGFLVPRTEQSFPLLGVLFADSVFPHHAPAGRRLVRVFMGGPRDPGAARRSDDELLGIAMPQLRRVLGVKGDPVLVDICRAHAAIPQYRLGHDEMIRKVRDLVSAHHGLSLVGNYLDGVSINDCIRSAAQLAERILKQPDEHHPPPKPHETTWLQAVS